MFGDVTIAGVNVTFAGENVTLDGDSVTLNGETGGVVVSMWFDICVEDPFVVDLSSSVTISCEWRLKKYWEVQLLESEDDESDPLGDGGNEFPVINFKWICRRKQFEYVRKIFVGWSYTPSKLENYSLSFLDIS